MLTDWLPLQEPDNEVYKKALVMTEKVCSSLLNLGWRCWCWCSPKSIQCCCLQAPALHAQLQEQLQEQVSCPQC